ncbi:MAG: alanine--tRNA ligase [Bdellovibrio sp.]|nr:alanine--tRNA ligase [Bdellovibrio sp.]
MKAAEIRSLFLKYFENHGHTIVESSALVPQNDPTLLFTNAGMVQFKDVFLGKDRRAYKRATTSQKCVRAGGKHNDLENVGFTARHHTFFEMLGNFSFGDYFKKDAIHFAWEFVTRELKLSKDRLYVSVYEKDDEAAEIWHKNEGVPKERIYRFGEKDNFWAMGDTGPCGPCSEIFYDRGEKYGCKKPTCGMGCDCDRYMEFWNLVFMQYERSSDGKLNPLPKPSVDTGAGLERIASILQEVDTNYDTDLFQDIIQKTAEISGKKYDPKSELAVSFRVVADHSRATTFLVGDGVLPSNEGRGYVLRRIIRRAIRHGKKLGFTGPFLNQVTGFVIDQMKDAYPDLASKKAFIEKAVIAEEEQFFKTLERGLSLLDEETAKLVGSSLVLPGEVAFKLYDTYGFPLDLTRVICEEKKIQVDEIGFEKAMDRQRSESRKHWKGSGEQALDQIYLNLAKELKDRGELPVFKGYEKTSAQGKCVAILVPSENKIERVQSYLTPSLAASADSIEKSALIEVVFAETPFYGESGGQVGDQGRVLSSAGSSASFLGDVIDVQKPVPDLIVAHVRPRAGKLEVGAEYLQETDREIRAATARNHTATHMLQWALKKVLGDHVKQAGSLVTPDLLRFDFSHFQAMTEKEILQVEDLINEKIWLAQSVSKTEMNKEDAIKSGAVAFFGEKYGDRVRVVRVGDFSTELCGGTHVENSSDIHLFKFANESGIAAGVRRIVAYTSKGAFNYLRSRDQDIKTIRDRLKVSSADEILTKIDKLFSVERELRQQLGHFHAQNASGEVDQLLTQAKLIRGVSVVAAVVSPDAQGAKKLRDMADRIKQKNPNSLIVLGMKEAEGTKASLLVAVGPAAQKAAKANELLQAIVGMIEGRGGGKPDQAQAGGTNAAGLSNAIAESVKWAETNLKS